MTISDYTKEERQLLQKQFGKGGYKFKIEHCGDTLYVKQDGKFRFYTMNPRIVINALRDKFDLN